MVKKKRFTAELALFFVMVALIAFANGMSDQIYSNFFKEVYNVDSVQRGFIEFPRELPGLLCALVIALLSSIGDIKTALIAQILGAAGLLALGLYTPVFGLMCVFLFTNSLGMHMLMPLQDSICMDLAEPGKVGLRMGQAASVKAALTFAAAICVFFGFRSGLFSFASAVKPVFLIGVGGFLLAAIVTAMLIKKVKQNQTQAPKRVRFIFRRQYKYYYMVTILHGVQKQIAFVYGSWVIIDLLGKGADTMALLFIVSNFICIFFMNFLGKWMDKYGIRRMMFLDALTFIVIYVIYGFAVWGISSGALSAVGWPTIAIFALFVLDRLSMQIGMVKSVYLRDIAVNTEDVTATLATGTALDHIVSIVAAIAGGVIWAAWGSQWVFFMAAAFSLGNLYVAWRINPAKERAEAQRLRRLEEGD